MTAFLATHGTSGLVLSLDDEVANERIVSEIKRGRYEASELAIASRFVRESDRVLELGAGVGFISAGVMRNVGPAYYAAVEADARLIPHIRETHDRNAVHGVEVINAAFTSDPETLAAGAVAFTLHREFWRSGIGQTQPGSAETVSVPARDVSRFLDEKDITVLIADIEGAELELLRHMDTAGLEKIVLELHPQRIGKAGVLEIFQILCASGFAYNTALSEGSVVCFEAVTSRSAATQEPAFSTGRA
ncbi:FkbM family methyltransferase [Stappia sp. ES.058]|uniref:FkbM family methyltransferase n=1 Tax=Stappia sp. ES.058 TaxID=1881061 RepID=UPI000879A16B|nr:FkbM family methyltransferase [Stappia sp. ES.058]SDU30858.1 methyltransferase, FkbM family [Stappia sp. ES.058]